MNDKQESRRIYRAILDSLDESPKKRNELIESAVTAVGITVAEHLDNSVNSRYNLTRSIAGALINELYSKKTIKKNSDGYYSIVEDKPIAIRREACEEEILRTLRASTKTRKEIKDSLSYYFSIDATDTKKDDARLFAYIGQILKRLVAEGVLSFDGSRYSIAPGRVAEIKSREDILSLKADFLTALHSRGGEFFEHYFMNLLAKYLTRCGKVVTESYITGGASDGGIDGIAKTVDSLGFRETIMVQTKNRLDIIPETDVRGFYGAVCARQGSRGIFATSSEFHPVAKEFLDSIDNCVGVDGSKIFTMACDTNYGIKRIENKLMIDRDII